MKSFFESVGGRKLVIVVLALVAVLIVGLVLKIDGEKILETIKWLAGIGAGSIALEDGLKAIGTGKTEENPPAS